MDAGKFFEKELNTKLHFKFDKKDKKGNIIEDEFNIDPHTFSAIWYALDGYEVTDLKQFNRTKYGI